MRLIDADKFKQQIAGMTIVNNYPAEKANAWCELIDVQPTAYDMDKVVEQLEEEKEIAHADFDEYVNEVCPSLDADYDDLYHMGLERGIEIVKGGGVDAN